MALALKMANDSTSIGEEAQRRIASARQSDIMFLIKTIARGNLTDDDIRMLVDVLFESDQKHLPLTKHLVEEQLLQRGRSANKAKQLSNSIFK